MSFSFIVIDKENALNLKEFVKFCKEEAKDFEVIYCSGILVNNTEVINYIVSKNENTEKIINSVTLKATKDILIVVRDVKQYIKCKDLMKNYTKSDQIICLQKNRSKFKQKWFTFVKNSIAKVFSHNLVSIDYSVILYGAIATRILKEVKLPAVLMRTNKWNGIKFVYIANNEGNYKQTYQKKKFIWGICTTALTAILLFVLSLTVLKMNIIASVLYFAVILILLFTCFIFSSKLILNSYLGDNITEKAEITLNVVKNKQDKPKEKQPKVNKSGKQK